MSEGGSVQEAMDIREKGGRMGHTGLTGRRDGACEGRREWGRM